ncbi:MAG: hypothetical protein HN413_01375 [Chloroflexi bacterium]|nr:hypothetical protein [Chloroflexota bacterium]MBT4400152.1 hypothetical protein [Bacteroidota bacterium]
MITKRIWKLFVIISYLMMVATPVFAGSGLPDVIDPEPVSGTREGLGPFDNAFYSPGPGFNVGDLEVTSYDKRDRVTIPYPLNASRFLAMCPIDAYLPNGEDDVSWSCTWEFDNTRQQATFTLSSNYDSGNNTQIGATAILISLDDFDLVDYAEFTITNNSNGVYALDYSPGDAIVIAVNIYETNTDDDFSFSIYPNDSTSAFDYKVNAWNGNDGSYIKGQIAVFKPLGDALIAIDAVNLYNNNSIENYFDLPSAGRTAYFASIYSYVTNDDDDFYALSAMDPYGYQLAETGHGNNGSNAAIEFVMLKR